MVSMGIVADTASQEFSRSLELVSEWGLREIELSKVNGRGVWELGAPELREVESQVRAHGLSVVSIASEVMRCQPTDEEELKQLALFDHVASLAERFGAKMIRGYAYLKQPDLEPIWPRIVRTWQRLGELAEARGLTINLENSAAANVQTVAELRRFLDAVRHPSVQLCWDTGNGCAVGDTTPLVEAWHTLKDRISYVHIKDASALGTNDWVPAGSGVLHLQQFVATLIAEGYQGTLCLEPYYFYDEWGPDRERKVRASVEGLRRILRGD